MRTSIRWTCLFVVLGVALVACHGSSDTIRWSYEREVVDDAPPLQQLRDTIVAWKDRPFPDGLEDFHDQVKPPVVRECDRLLELLDRTDELYKNVVAFRIELGGQVKSEFENEKVRQKFAAATLAPARRTQKVDHGIWHYMSINIDNLQSIAGYLNENVVKAQASGAKLQPSAEIVAYTEFAVASADAADAYRSRWFTGVHQPLVDTVALVEGMQTDTDFDVAKVMTATQEHLDDIVHALTELTGVKYFYKSKRKIKTF